MKPYIYIETSVVSYLTARPSKDLVKLQTMPVLPITEDIPRLAEFLLLGGGLPSKARLDALHIACAAYHEIDVLVTWNCTHIANPSKLPVLRGLCAAKGYKLPELVTPFELMETL